MSTENKKAQKEFGLTTLAVNNRKTVYLISFLILIAGFFSYNSMPKENFPELVIPEIYVLTPYPGGSPKFVEDKITEPFEKEFNSIKNVEKITSTSIYGFSSIKIEFEFKVSVSEARRKVQDAIADARSNPEFPELQIEPTVKELDFSEMPVMNVNLSGNVHKDDLKKYAEILEDRIEALAEVNEVDIRGVQEKKMKIELRNFEAQAKGVSFGDIENAIRRENITMPGGEILIGGKNRSVRIEGEFISEEEIKNIIVKQEDGTDEVYLHEVANVSFGDADITSYAREFQKSVVMLDIKKRSGENLLAAADKIHLIVKERVGIPKSIKIGVTNDQSSNTRSSLSNLVNSIIFGIILVVLVLMFFLGLRNALFVGVAIPLSMFMSFMILGTFGVTLNTMVLFSLVIALGMLVDNGIVVVENIYRLMAEGYKPMRAARLGVGEIAWPIIASTATTLAAFVPLAMWPGMMGEFMKFLPITLMVVLSSSLFVALVINPVLTAVWMKVEESIPNMKKLFRTSAIMIGLGLLFIVMGGTGLGNILIVLGVFALINVFFFSKWIKYFQEKILPKIENLYANFLKSAVLSPRKVLLGTIGLLFLSFLLIIVFPPKTLFFPENEPLYVNVYIETPIGTDIKVTNDITLEIEKIVNDSIISKYKENYVVNDVELSDGTKLKDTVYFITSMIAQVGEGTADPSSGQVASGSTPHKARISVNFADFEDRNSLKTVPVMEEIKKVLTGKFPADVSIVVDKNSAGPPQEPPVNIEVSGPDEYQTTVNMAEYLKQYLHAQRVDGVEKLKLNVETGKPELLLNIDRNKAIRFGVSTSQIANTIRTSIFGSDVSTYKKGDETYDINVRLDKSSRNNINEVLDQKITFRNNKGKMLNIPIRSVVKGYNELSTYGSVVRKDLKQLVKISSSITAKANANEVVEKLKSKLDDFYTTKNGIEFKNAGYEIKFTGQMEQQAKEMGFLLGALAFALFLIVFIIVMQFNSFSAPVIILSAVFLSLIGVLLGLVIFRQPFIIMMTMIGIISLAGIVVNNAIVLIDYISLLQTRRKRELGLEQNAFLPIEDVVSSIIEGGKTRLRPVLLTAITTILGLLPLATGLNIDFVNLFTHYDANISVGGDNVMFFGPMSWTIIYGLTFATFLTLVVVPIMYLLLHKMKVKSTKNNVQEEELILAEDTLLD